MPEREVWIQTKYKTFFDGKWALGRLALYKGEGEGEGLILSRWQLVLTLTPHLHPLPFVRGEAIRLPLAGDAPALQHVLIAFWLRHTNYRYVAPYQ